MGVILGFGSCEESERNRIRAIIQNALKNGEDIQKISKEHNENNKKFDAMSRQEAPERYTNFYTYDNKIRFHHINRQHPFSPDGWALWIVEEYLTNQQEAQQ